MQPSIYVTYNGDNFDWPFIEARATHHDLCMHAATGFRVQKSGECLSKSAVHMDCLCWVNRDSYLPQGSRGLKVRLFSSSFQASTIARDRPALGTATLRAALHANSLPRHLQAPNLHVSPGSVDVGRDLTQRICSVAIARSAAVDVFGLWVHALDVELAFSFLGGVLPHHLGQVVSTPTPPRTPLTVRQASPKAHNFLGAA